MQNIGKKIAGVLLFLVLISGSFGAGYYAASDHRKEIEKVQGLSGKETGKNTDVDFSAFWKAWNILNQKFVATKTGTGTTTDEDKVWGAISGLTASLGDPYTVFFPPADKKLFESEISGNFEGAGMEIGLRDGILTVIAPLKGSPAERAGIKTGDKIFKVNGVSTQDMSVDKAVEKIRGKKGTTVAVEIFREGIKEPFEIKIVRDVINIPTLETEKRPDGIFVIRLYSFSANVPDLWRKAIQQFIDSGYTRLILDLRGNPGGYLEAAVDIASFFVPQGKVVVRENFGKTIPEELYRSAGYNIFNSNLKFIILVDGGSASASEILAGALREHGVAKLVGTKTFGKGSVQELVPVTADTSLKVTVARWLTPNGVSISEGGLVPDVEIKQPKVEEGRAPKDAQLEKAVQMLLR